MTANNAEYHEFKGRMDAQISHINQNLNGLILDFTGFKKEVLSLMESNKKEVLGEVHSVQKDLESLKNRVDKEKGNIAIWAWSGVGTLIMAVVAAVVIFLIQNNLK